MSVLIYSGGMDSTTLLHYLYDKGYQPHVLMFDYGQRHKIELGKGVGYLESVNHPSLQYEIVDLQDLSAILPGGSQTDSSIPVPHGHYEADNMKLTVVPNRNMIMLSIAAAYAMARGIKDVYFGAHGGDHAIYPDCRPKFVQALNVVLGVSHWKGITVHAPFINMDKGEICQLGARLGVDYSLTWTCYDPQWVGQEDGDYLHCGKCGSCTERKEAFQSAKVDDPTLYKE